MKDFLNKWGVLILAIGLMAATAGVGTKYTTSAEKAQVYNWTLDTITDAENDTLTITSLQTSNWYGALHIDGRQISGTQMLAVIVQRSCHESPATDQWDEETRDSVNGSSEQVIIDLGRMECFNYRVIVDGAGTQVAEYDAVLSLKKD
ncbi:MAG: hypothetical protein IPH04_14615 [Saprospirales bacterium]|nr:hypothetical protein [Saprospirales bacterium]